MAKPTIGPKSKSSTAKKDAELRKLLDKPDFPSFDRMMKKLIALPKEEIDSRSQCAHPSKRKN
jgi:hypothetical protein